MQPMKHDGYRKEAGQERAELAVERGLDVVNRAAVYRAVCVNRAGFLGKDSLGVVGGHAQEGDDPHPEDCARAADEDCAASAYDVAGTDLGGDCGCHSLEGAHAALVLFAVQRKAAEHPLQAFAEAANLNEASTDGEEQACTDKQDDQNIVRQIRVDGLDD